MRQNIINVFNMIKTFWFIIMGGCAIIQLLTYILFVETDILCNITMIIPRGLFLIVAALNYMHV